MGADWEIDGRFDRPVNATVVGFLRRTLPSAHGDVAEELQRSAAALGGVASWCPDAEAYAFVVLHRADGTLVGLAWGQGALAYRLPGAVGVQARSEGAVAAPELGPDWVRMAPWTDDETLEASRRRLARWCARAVEAP